MSTVVAYPDTAPAEAGAPTNAAGPPRSSQPARETAAWLTAHRMISLVAALGLLWPAFMAWKDIVSAPGSGIVAVILTGGALLLACLIGSAGTERALERLDRWLLVLGLLILVVWASSALGPTAGYTTDEAAFVHGAANLLLHGHDPYGADLLPNLARFGVPPIYWTYTMNGGAVSTLGYPALPVLVAAPFVALFGSGQAVAIAEVLVLLVATAVAFAVLPRPWRSLAVVLCVAFPALGGFAIAGLTAVLMLPALIVVARGWARVGERGTLSTRDRLGAIALGLALSTNQLGWFIAPFLLVGIALLRSPYLGARGACKVTGRYGGLALLTFAALNAPFILWGPTAWWQGVAAPLTQHAIPYGQGLVGLTVFLRLGGGAVNAYGYAAAALYVALLVLYAARFRTLARSCFILPAVALYASGRSLAEYWLVLVVPIVIGALAVDAAALRTAAQVTWPRDARRPRLSASVVLPGLFAPAAALLAVALLTPAPLSIRVLSAALDPQRAAVVRLRVLVRNNSDAPLRPHFAIDSSGQATPFWRIIAGPTVLAPGASVRYSLAAAQLDPAAAKPFLLQAVTSSPSTISSSPLFSPPVQSRGW